MSETPDEPSGQNPADNGGRRAKGVDIFDHVGLIVLLAVFGLAAVYTLVDAFFLLEYTAIGMLPKWPFAVVAAIATALAIGIGRGAPRLERYAMVVLVAVATTWAVYPAMLRINAVTGEAEIAVYRPTAVGQFEAASGQYPPIDLAGDYAPAYWERHGTEARHRFRLIKGSLGFYQLDLTPLYARMSRFREQQDQLPVTP